MQAGVSAGPNMVAPFLTAAGTSMAAKIAANPQLSTQQVLQQVQQSLAALMQQSQVIPHLPAPSATLLAQPRPAAAPAPVADPDPALLNQMSMLFGQLGFDSATALDYARYVTPGYQPSRTLGAEEIALIDAILKSPNIETLVESASGLQQGQQQQSPVPQPQMQTQMQPFQEPPLPQWVRLATESSLFVRGVVLVVGGWLIWQLAIAHRPEPVRQVEQVVKPTQIAQPSQPLQPTVTQPATVTQYAPADTQAQMKAWARVRTGKSDRRHQPKLRSVTVDNLLIYRLSTDANQLFEHFSICRSTDSIKPLQTRRYLMPFGFDRFDQTMDRMNERFPEPTKSAAPPPEQPEPPRPAETSRAVPVSFSQPFNAAGGGSPFEDLNPLSQVSIVDPSFLTPSSSGNWQPYNPTNAGSLLRDIRPLTVEERRYYEAQAVDLETGREETVKGLKSLVAAHRDASEITRTTINARVDVAKEDLATGKVLATGVTTMMGLAPDWAKIKSQLGYSLDESAHKQKLSVAGVTGQLYASLGG